MKKYILYVTFILLFNTEAYCKSITPENFVRDFYIWYCNALLNHKIQIDPVFDEKIFDYVNKCTVNRLRINSKRGFVGEDYFIKSNDFWQELIDDMAVLNAISIDSDVSIVPVVFKVTKNTTHSIIVFIAKKNNSYTIIKVEDTNYE
jgi:hypothetical protein